MPGVKKTTMKRRSLLATDKPAATTPQKKSRRARSMDGVPEELQRPTEVGVVLAFGQNDVGQLGLGLNVDERKYAAAVPGLDNIVDICAGGMHTLCLTSSGDVISFGCNDDGALGREVGDDDAAVPGRVDLPEPAVRISAGDSHSSALLRDGRVFAWGSFRDRHGGMGLTAEGAQRLPIEVLPGIRVTHVASGDNHLVLLSEDKDVYTCGCAEQGQLGRITRRSSDREQIRCGIGMFLEPSILQFKRTKIKFDNIWAGGCMTFARQEQTNNIFVCGLNNYHQLGINTNDECQYQPVVSGEFLNRKFTKISAGDHHVLALDDEGVVHTLGRKEYGRLGLGENAGDAFNLTAVPALNDRRSTDIDCGSAVSFAVSEGTLYSWGFGTNFQLGTGDDDDKYVPTAIAGRQLESKRVIRVSAGGQHTVVLASVIHS